MYSVYIDGTCIYNDQYLAEQFRLINPRLILEDNSAGSFDATIPLCNAGYNSIKRLLSVVTIKRDNVEIWEGRIISEQDDFWKNKKITCEGEMSYLNDTIQPPAEYHNITPREFLEILIKIHNSKVPQNKMFAVGIVTITDNDTSNNANELYRYTNYESTLECIKTKLVDKLGGHIRVRKYNGIRYIDYLKDYIDSNDQAIRFGVNLLDFTKNWDLSDLATVVVPRGASLEESPIEALTAYLTVESVNKNSIYVQSEDAVAQFGWIETVVDWQDVHDPSILLSKAKKYLADYQFDKMVLELKAVDMHYVSNSNRAINLLEQIRCISLPHGMDRYFPVTKIELHLDKPESNVYILGEDDVKTLTSATTHSATEIIQRIENLPTKQNILREAKDNATAMIQGATHGYVVMNYDDNGPYELLIMDSNDIKKAKNVWRWNAGGFGFSSNGYNGPYGLAMTMNGAIVADFITAGTMYANRIKGGQLTMGGNDNENGVIYVKDSNGNTVITIDCNGINVNNAFTVDTSGNIKAFSISGNAMEQFSNAIDNSDAMRKANEAITVANSAASAAKTAADDAYDIAYALEHTHFPYLNGVDLANQQWIQRVENRVAALEAGRSV